jgi:hypothetical protein
MQKRRPLSRSGADQLGGDRAFLTKSTMARPQLDDLTSQRALHLIQGLGLRPELATMLAALAFGGGR